MDIETAANIGEAASGIAILFTLLFSLRQIKYWNENRRYEIGRDLANHLSDPLIHRGFSVSMMKLHEDITMQEINELTREEKNAMNAMMIGINNIGLLAMYGHLSMDLVEGFYGRYIRIFGPRWRQTVKVFSAATAFAMGLEDDEETMWDGLLWLMDNLKKPDSEDSE